MNNISTDTINLIKHYESLHDGDLKAVGLQPKMCPAGIWTVGYGHAVTDASGKQLKGQTTYEQALALYPAMTVQEAEALLAVDLRKFAASVAPMIKQPVNGNQFGALVSFAYNVGVGALRSSTLLKKVNAGDYAGAAAEFPKWDKATVNGKTVALAGLTARRKSEQYLFTTGIFKPFN